LDERTPKARAAVMKFFIQIADVRALSPFFFSSLPLPLHYIRHISVPLSSPTSHLLIPFRVCRSQQRCLELNNFASVAAIGAGLNSSSISRLYRTFDLLSPKTTSVLETLKESVSSERNFSAYKARLQRLNPPAVPFLGSSPPLSLPYLPLAAAAERIEC
jgi:hypothetical protein